MGPVLAALHRRGFVYTLAHRLPAGAWGAWLVRDEGGEPAVLKCIWDSDWRGRLESARQVVDVLRARRAPVPRYLGFDFDPDLGTWCLQSHLKGAPVTELDPQLLDDLLRVVELQEGAGSSLQTAYNWTERVAHWMESRALTTIGRARSITPGGPRLATRLENALETGQGRLDYTADAVHGDLLATQLLSQQGHLTGVLDWDAAGRGDRCQDLTLLLYNTFAQADRLGRNVNSEVLATLMTGMLEWCGAERVGWFLAYEVLSTTAFVLDHNPKHAVWRTELGLQVFEELEKFV